MRAVVAIVSSRVEAELIAGMLRGHGVNALVSADDLGGVDIALQMQGVRVLVSEEDESTARQLLNQLEPSVSAPTSPNGFQKWLVKILGGGN
jgi:hypothetical protein